MPPPSDKPAPRCVLCGTAEGYYAGPYRPIRYRTDRYGLPGVCCAACYKTVCYRFTHGLDVELGRGHRVQAG